MPAFLCLSNALANSRALHPVQEPVFLSTTEFFTEMYRWATAYPAAVWHRNGGVGNIALAGIVVNNHIVLIDCYNDLRRQGREPLTAAPETGSLRLRPALLTAVTTVLGLMPMALAMNIDLLDRAISFGAPSTQWWTQLSTAIAGGLSFATVLTLFLKPCLLVLGEKRWIPRISWKNGKATAVGTADSAV